MKNNHGSAGNRRNGNGQGHNGHNRNHRRPSNSGSNQRSAQSVPPRPVEFGTVLEVRDDGVAYVHAREQNDTVMIRYPENRKDLDAATACIAVAEDGKVWFQPIDPATTVWLKKGEDVALKAGQADNKSGKQMARAYCWMRKDDFDKAQEIVDARKEEPKASPVPVTVKEFVYIQPQPEPAVEVQPEAPAAINPEGAWQVKLNGLGATPRSATGRPLHRVVPVTKPKLAKTVDVGVMAPEVSLEQMLKAAMTGNLTVDGQPVETRRAS